MANSADTFTVLAGNFKEVYGDLHNLIPDTAKMMKMIPFKPKAKIGNEYVEAVKLTHEHGVTYSSSDNNAGALVTLSTPIPLTLLDAKVTSSAMLLRAQIGYDAFARAEGGDKVAFKDASELVVEDLLESITKRLEISVLYGASLTGIGGIPLAGAEDNGSGVLTVILNAAQWATGIWVGSENAQVDIYHGSTKLNTSAPFTVTSVNPDTYTLTLTETDAPTNTSAAAVDAYTDANSDAFIVFTGSFGNEMTGIDAVMTNTGTLWNIASSSYALWTANVYDALSANLTMGKLQSAIQKAVQKGLDGDVNVIVNPATWATLNTDLAALRRFVEDSTEGELGVESIKYLYSGGKMDIVAYNLCKEGECFILPKKGVNRIGAADIGFKLPGGDNGFLHVPDRMGYEFRLFSSQAFFTPFVAKLVKVKNIVNS
jgi:hypothetical protein